MKTTLTQRVLRELKKDPRVKELYLTMLERPLNALEQLMFNQILREYTNGTERNFAQ